MELRFQSNFSKKLRFSFHSDTEFSRSDSPMGRPNESLREIISCETTTTLVPKHTIAVSLTYNFRKNLTIHQEASEAMLKASISRSFGENFSLELKGENLLNSRQDKRIGRTAQYEYRRGENQMGRYVTLQFSCKF
jgi:outer membrane receptor protein involved in Fe transport